MAEQHISLRKKAVAAIVAVVFLNVVGTVVYHKLEGWSYLDSAYFTVITLTTIGYGDMAPSDPISKVFTMMFVISGVSIFIFAMSVLAEHYFTRRVGVHEKTVRRVGTQAQKAVNMIRAGVQEAVKQRDKIKPLRLDPPLLFRDERYEETWTKPNDKPYVRILDPRIREIEADDIMDLMHKIYGYAKDYRAPSLE